MLVVCICCLSLWRWRHLSVKTALHVYEVIISLVRRMQSIPGWTTLTLLRCLSASEHGTPGSMSYVNTITNVYIELTCHTCTDSLLCFVVFMLKTKIKRSKANKTQTPSRAKVCIMVFNIWFCVEDCWIWFKRCSLYWCIQINGGRRRHLYMHRCYACQQLDLHNHFVFAVALSKDSAIDVSYMIEWLRSGYLSLHFLTTGMVLRIVWGWNVVTL